MKHALLLSLILVAGPAFAKSAAVSVEDGVILRPLKGSNATAGYGILKNTSARPVTLSVIGAAGFKAVELHETVSENGMAKMRKMETVKIEPGEKFVLKPGGNHIMLFDPTRELHGGEKLRIEFNDGKEKFSLPFTVKARSEEESHSHH